MRRPEAVKKHVDSYVGEFGWLDATLGIVPSVGIVDDPEQDHRIDGSCPLPNLAPAVELDEEVGNSIDELPLQALDGLLTFLIQERQIVQQHFLLGGRAGVERH